MEQYCCFCDVSQIFEQIMLKKFGITAVGPYIQYLCTSYTYTTIQNMQLVIWLSVLIRISRHCAFEYYDTWSKSDQKEVLHMMFVDICTYIYLGI